VTLEMSGPLGGGTDGAVVTANAVCLLCLQPKNAAEPKGPPRF
jgi:hypothetical protein